MTPNPCLSVDAVALRRHSQLPPLYDGGNGRGRADIFLTPTGLYNEEHCSTQRGVLKAVASQDAPTTWILWDGESSSHTGGIKWFVDTALSHGLNTVYTLASWMSAFARNSPSPARGDLLDQYILHWDGLDHSKINGPSRWNYLEHFREALTIYIDGAPVLPTNLATRQRQLSEVVQLIATQDDIHFLERWLKEVIDHGLTPADGLSPDSAAAALLKQIAKLDFDAGWRWCEALILAKTPWPRVKTRFKLTAAAILINRFAAQRPNDFEGKRAFRLLSQVKIAYNWRASLNVDVSSSLLASVLSLVFLTADDDIESVLSLDAQFFECVQLTSDQQERQAFLEFITDCLGNFIEQNDLHLHVFKLLIVQRYFGDNATAWSNKYFVSLLERVRKVTSRLTPVFR